MLVVAIDVAVPSAFIKTPLILYVTLGTKLLYVIVSTKVMLLLAATCAFVVLSNIVVLILGT